ncbi:MAG: C39 family peptidase [Verrucomicrobiae bacterium]|nr:C39 family peptidase [Verrucomicrobiae bacterium]MCP5541243.1 C39 family peptidase [Akkermansiaceae bacterium]
MKNCDPLRLIPPVLALSILLTTNLRSDEFRSFTNAKGQTIEAKVIGLQGAQVTIEMKDGRKFTVPANSLSAEDQSYLKTWKPAPTSAGTPLKEENGVTIASLNEVVGAELFKDIALWESAPEDTAKRLDWPRESKTPYSESFRAYPREAYRFLGARPYSAALYGEDGKVTGLSIVFANKGDSFGSAGSGEEHFIKGKPVPGGLEGLRMIMENDAETISSALTGLLGESDRQKFGEGETRTDVQRWDWNGHAFLLSHVEDEYVGLSIQPVEFADKRGRSARVPDSLVRERARGNVEARENGDVVIGNLPMVDQGPKGYCVPATAERCMRYLGIPADMYLLAMAGETKIGGGTSVSLLLNNIGQDIKRKGRKFESWTGEFKLRDLKKYIDDGIPVMWTLFSTKEFNQTANQRSKERKETADFAAYAGKVKADSEANSLPADRTTGHVVIVIGYNETTNEIAFSDSWGERFAERWITIPEAEQISQQYFYVIDL